DGQVDLQHSHDRANQPFALAQRQSKHRSQCQSRLNGKIGIVRLAARRGSGLRLPTSQRFVGEPNRKASTIAKRCVIVTPVRHSMPLTWNVASALGMEFERHDRTSRWQRRSSVAKLLKRPPRPYPCTKVTRRSVEPMSEPPHFRQADPHKRGRRLAGPPKQASRQSRLAIHDRPRPGETQKTIPRTLSDSGD